MEKTITKGDEICFTFHRAGRDLRQDEKWEPAETGIIFVARIK
jgi:hypothetical protein